MLSFKYSSEYIKVDQNDTTTTLTNIIATSFKSNTCFIGDWIQSDDTMTHRLTIRLDKLSSEACFFIGLSPSDERTENKSMEECCSNCYGYCGNGRIYFNDKELGTVEDCSEGDTLDLVYNVPNRTLRLQINQHHQVPLFTDILAVKYKFAISLSYAADQCTIIRHVRVCSSPITNGAETEIETETVSQYRSSSNVILGGTESPQRASSLEIDTETVADNLINGAGTHVQMNMITKEDSSSDEAVETDQMVSRQAATGNIQEPEDDESDNGVPVKVKEKSAACLSCHIL